MSYWYPELEDTGSPYDEGAPQFDASGMPTGSMPRGGNALQWQHEANRFARQRREALWGDAQQALESGRELFQSYRPGGSAALASGAYSQSASLYGTQALNYEASDMLIGFREEQRQIAEKRKKDQFKLSMMGQAFKPLSGGMPAQQDTTPSTATEGPAAAPGGTAPGGAPLGQTGGTVGGAALGPTGGTVGGASLGPTGGAVGGAALGPTGGTVGGAALGPTGGAVGGASMGPTGGIVGGGGVAGAGGAGAAGAGTAGGGVAGAAGAAVPVVGAALAASQLSTGATAGQRVAADRFAQSPLRSSSVRTMERSAYRRLIEADGGRAQDPGSGGILQAGPDYGRVR